LDWWRKEMTLVTAAVLFAALYGACLAIAALPRLLVLLLVRAMAWHLTRRSHALNSALLAATRPASWRKPSRAERRLMKRSLSHAISCTDFFSLFPDQRPALRCTR
jgi:hypothetical protein